MEIGDAYGELMLAGLEGQTVAEIVEREDGFIDANPAAAAFYMAPFRRWPAHHRQAMRFVRGRVLDVGCGAGRVCLHLQERGHDVVGIDASPAAIDVSRRRGVRDARPLRFEDIGSALGRFDTVLMLGNNFGLFGGARKARRLLRKLRLITNERARIVAETRDVRTTDVPEHLQYQESNRERGRLPGQVRIRVRYRSLATPWFDYLMVGRDELEELLHGTGWRLARTLDSDDTYVAVIERD